MKKQRNKTSKDKPKSGSKERAMYAYPKPDEVLVLRRAMKQTGESESRYLVESGLLRAKVVDARITRELDDARSLVSSSS